MGACTSIKNSVEVKYNTQSSTFTFRNLLDLRAQIKSKFNLDDKFLLLHNNQIVKSSNELIIISRSSKKSSKLQVSTCDDPLTASKSQVSIGKSLALILLNKFIVFPEWLFSESTIDTNSITISNEEYQLKNYYVTLDVPGLVLGKIKKSGRKINSLVDLDKDLENIEKLFVLKDMKKVPILSLSNMKHLTCSLVYNDKHSPVGILSWDGKNSAVSLNVLKSSVHFAIHFTSLPNENLPVSMSNLNILNGNHVFTEYAAIIKSNKLITYHPNDFNISSYQIDKNLEGFTITQTPFGFVFSYGFEVYKFNLSNMHSLPKPGFSHTYHSALFHSSCCLLISGAETAKVESLNMQNLSWNLLPDLPNPIENPASCSYITSIYVLGGKVGSIATDTVYKLDEGSKFWEKLNWTIPFSASAASALAFGKEIIVFGGMQSEKDKFVVYDNGKEVNSGFMGHQGNFEGMLMGKVNLTGVCFSRQGQIFRYDHVVKKFFLMSIGNYYI